MWLFCLVFMFPMTWDLWGQWLSVTHRLNTSKLWMWSKQTTSSTTLLFDSLPQPHWPSSSLSMFPTSGLLYLLFLEYPSVLCQTSSILSFRLHLKCHFLQEVIILSKAVPDISCLFSPSTTTIILRCLIIILGLYVFLRSEHCCFVYIFTWHTILCCRSLCLTLHLGSCSEYLFLFSVHLICCS